jgi:hypothetical protein
MALNTILGVASESVAAVADVMLLPSLILAFFVAELTPSYTTIGLVPAIAISFWTLARLPAHLITAGRRRMQPWAFGAALVRAGAITILAVVASRTDPTGLGQSARPLLGTFFLCLTVFALAGGFGSVPHAALLRASLAAESWPPFVRRRSFVSALLGLLGALVVARLLGSDALLFPGNYGRLFLAATVCLIAVAVFTAAMREPAVMGSASQPPTLTPRALRQPLADPRYQRFLLFRVLLSVTAASDPFLFLYAVTRIGIPVTTIGSYALAAVLGWVISAPVWIRLEHRSGPRALLQSASVVRLIAPAIALALPQVAATDALRDRLPGSSPLTVIFGAAFFALGTAMAAQSRGNFDYLAGLVPRTLLPAYAGLTNALFAVVAFSPVAGGAFIQRFSYEALFGAVAVIGLAAVFAGGWLVRTPATARNHPNTEPENPLTRRALPTGRALMG